MYNANCSNNSLQQLRPNNCSETATPAFHPSLLTSTIHNLKWRKQTNCYQLVHADAGTDVTEVRDPVPQAANVWSKSRTFLDPFRWDQMDVIVNMQQATLVPDMKGCDLWASWPIWNKSFKISGTFQYSWFSLERETAFSVSSLIGIWAGRPGMEGWWLAPAVFQLARKVAQGGSGAEKINNQPIIHVQYLLKWDRPAWQQPDFVVKAKYWWQSAPFLEIKVNFALPIGHVPSRPQWSVQQGNSRSDPCEETAEHKPDQTKQYKCNALHV